MEFGTEGEKYGDRQDNHTGINGQTKFPERTQFSFQNKKPGMFWR